MIPKTGQVIITVEDNGSGISEDLHDKIFDPFFTTKAPGKGTGLGLSVSYSIIQDHRGKIALESDTEVKIYPFCYQPAGGGFRSWSDVNILISR